MAKVKIPKRVGGMKIPKKVRKKANKAIEMADSPAIRELAAAALGAAASTRRASKGERDESGGERVSAAATIRIDANKFGEAFRSAALDGFRRFLEGFEEGLRKASAAAGDAADAVDERASNDEEERASRPAADAVVD